MTISKSKKETAGKPDLSLLPYHTLAEMARVMEFGAKKYGRDDFLKGRDWVSLSAAIVRHVKKWESLNEDLDTESGLHHMAHAASNCLMLLEYYFRNLGNDDRYKGNKNE